MIDQLGASDAHDAWSWFVERYRSYVRACLFRLLGQAHGVEAAEAEIWSYLFDSEVFEKADRSRRFRSFLSGIVRNFAWDWRRRNHYAQAADDEAVLHEAVAASTLPEHEETCLFARHLLYRAMEDLAAAHPESARALRLFYGVPLCPEAEFEAPLPVSVVAERMCIARNAVHQTLHRGRKRLRRRVEEELRKTVAHDCELEDELSIILEAMQQQVPGVTGS